MISENISENLANLAVKALVYEVGITPKPGLVDCANNGSHTDMNFFTFIDSSFSLYSYFREITIIGTNHKGDLTTLMPKLRKPGMLAEKEMFKATGGINTHKGAIFSMGIICATFGYMYANNMKITSSDLLGNSGIVASETVAELETASFETAGEKVFKNYGVTGARGEASAGFPSVNQIGLPVFNDCINNGLLVNDSGVIALLHLICKVEDTNIINRSDLKTLKEVQNSVNSALANTTNALNLIDYAKKLDQQFIKLNISPGGCADLLAVTIFVYLLENQL